MRDVLRTPGVLSLFVASCVARLPMGAIGLLLVLHTQALTGSYAAGGLAAGAYALALGLSNPVLGRVADRRGQTLLLRAGAPVAAAAIVAVALLPAGAPQGAIVACAVVGGPRPAAGRRVHARALARRCSAAPTGATPPTRSRAPRSRSSTSAGRSSSSRASARGRPRRP